MLTAGSEARSGSRGVGRVVRAAALALWAGVTVAAFEYFWRIDATPGVAAVAPGRAAAAGVFSVLVFLDSRCPCSRATVAELERTVAQVRSPVAFDVYFNTPDAADRSWEGSPLAKQAAGIPGVRVHADPGGVVAARYGVRTSGQVVAYRADGVLAYAGGITGSRGHEGDNAGKSGLLAAIRGESVGMTSAPVYGCGVVAAEEGPE